MYFDSLLEEYKLGESNLFIFSGFRKITDKQLNVSVEFLPDLWHLDLNSHFWEYRGETTISDLLEPNVDLRFVKIVPYKGNHLLITNYSCLLIDIKNNFIQKFEAFNSAIMTGASTISYNPISNQFMIISNNHINGKNKPVFISEQEFLSGELRYMSY